MKKLLLAVLAAFTLMTLVACGDERTNEEKFFGEITNFDLYLKDLEYTLNNGVLIIKHDEYSLPENDAELIEKLMVEYFVETGEKPSFDKVLIHAYNVNNPYDPIGNHYTNIDIDEFWEKHTK